MQIKNGDRIKALKRTQFDRLVCEKDRIYTAHLYMHSEETNMIGIKEFIPLNEGVGGWDRGLFYNFNFTKIEVSQKPITENDYIKWLSGDRNV